MLPETTEDSTPLAFGSTAELGPAFLHAQDGGAAYPADLVRTWPERNQKRFVAPLYDQAALDTKDAEIAELRAEVAVLRMACGRWEDALKNADKARRDDLAAERERWRALLGDARPWLVWSSDSPGTILDLNALLRRVNEACSMWRE